MIIFDGKVYRELTAEEISAAERTEAVYWQTVDYGDAVNAEIRKKYSESQEFAILRQKDDKSAEFEEYFAYCEECKAFVKSKKNI